MGQFSFVTNSQINYYMKHDLSDTGDIETLVNRFYQKVRSNPVIGHIFNDVAKVNWELPCT